MTAQPFTPSKLTGHMPRVPLAFLPTPLAEMKRLQAALGPDCPRLLIKRDDQTGLATGGNKTRKLEFLLGRALQIGADTVITVGAAQSNHCRQTAAAAARYGLACHLVLSGDPLPTDTWSGNLLLDDLLGATVHWCGERTREAVIEEVMLDVQAKGKRPFIITIGGSVPTGAAGYVAAVEELAGQLAVEDIQVDRMVVVSGSGGTHAGILAGVKALGLGCTVEGMDNNAVPDVAAVVRDLTAQTVDFLKLDVALSAEDVICIKAAGDHAYGVITDAERDALRLMARTEGILLDPVYTARAFAQMVTHIQAGQYKPDETVLFWHTGGVGGLFPRGGELV